VTKIVINAEHGGFQLSQKAIQKLIDEHGYEKTRVNEEGEYENPDAESSVTRACSKTKM